VKPSSAIERTNMMPKKTLFCACFISTWYFEEEACGLRQTYGISQVNFSPFPVLAVDLLFRAGREDLFFPNMFTVRIGQVMWRRNDARSGFK
jgi:hypothetical protein